MELFDSIRFSSLPDRVGFTLQASKNDFNLFSCLIYTLLCSRERHEITRHYDDWPWSHHLCISQYMRTSFVDRKTARGYYEDETNEARYAVDYDYITAFVMVRLFRSQLATSHFPEWVHDGVTLFEEIFKASLISDGIIDNDEYWDIVTSGFTTDTMTPPGMLAKINHFFRITGRQRINQTKEIFRSFSPWWDRQFVNNPKLNKKALTPRCFNISYHDYSLVREKMNMYAETFTDRPDLFFVGYFPVDWDCFDHNEVLKDFTNNSEEN